MRQAAIRLAAAVVLAANPASPAGAAPPEGPHPSPRLAPDEVVRIQLEALRANDERDRGIAIAFRFASPRNRASTGPLPRFARMIRQGYGLMLEWVHAEYGPLRVEGAHAVQPVILIGREAVVRYVFYLTRQKGGACTACWMTDAVTAEPLGDRPASASVTQLARSP
ncbi:MAG: DUF4864 domain-containing protein [Gammaproteobacteria bacterium]|nr:DUF4864 domain-containing protein [Gammaproteobacteria bacterium]